MISIESYRACIGTFAFTAQRNLRYIAKSLVVGTTLSSYGLSRILKPAPFVALLTFLTFAFPQSYKIVKASPQSQSVLNILSVTKNGLFVPYPVISNKSRDPTIIFFKVNFTLLLSGDIELNPGPYAQPSECAQARLIKVICIARFEITTGTHQCICVC